MLEAGLDEAFVVAGAVTLGGAVLTGWLVRSGTADGQGDFGGGPMGDGEGPTGFGAAPTLSAGGPATG